MGASQSPHTQPDQAGPAKKGFGYDAEAISRKAAPTNEVKLAASPLGGIPGAQAWHTSVIVNGDEFSFSDGGITAARGTDSHDAMAKQAQSSTQVQINTQVFDMGMSSYTGSQLRAALERYFAPGTYDLLKKNCNSFSDCAIAYLLRKRIDGKYRALESIGARNPGLIASLSGDGYTPNPKVQDFDLEKVIKETDPEKAWEGKGETTGGAVADSREAMRAARLARLGGGGGSSSGATPSGGAVPAAGSSSGAAPPGGATPSGGAAPSAPQGAEGGRGI